MSIRSAAATVTPIVRAFFSVPHAAAAPIQYDQSEIGDISRNSRSIYLLDGVLHSHQIAARRSCGLAGRVLGEFCFMPHQQEATLLSQTFDCF